MWIVSGCANQDSLPYTSAIQKKWTCDPYADELLKQHDYPSAIAFHERLLGKEPDNALALYHIGYAYGQMGDYHKEVSFYENAIGMGFQQGHIWYNLGMAYGELKNFEKSIHAFKSALRIDPKNAENHFGLALAYYQKGTADRLAEKGFLKAIKIDPNHLDARLHLSILYSDKGNLKEAGRHLRKILEIDPNNPRAIRFLEKMKE